MWVEILLDKYFSYRPTERLLASWRLLGLDLAPGTVTDGLEQLEALLRPIDEAPEARNSQGDLHQGDETRWRVFVALEGKEGYGRWLWVVLGPDTVIYLRDACRSHTVPENHFALSRVGCWWSIAMRPTRRWSGSRTGSWSWPFAGLMSGGISSGWVKAGRS